MTTEPPLTRPALRYHGGKWRLAPWIITHFPPHRTYTEAFGGGASVLLRKPRCYSEVYNDLDGGIVGLFRVLRDPATAAELERRLRLTPFARDEFLAAYEPTDDAIEAARRLLIRSSMGFGSTGAMGHRTGFRANTDRAGTTPAHDWRNYPDLLPALTARLAGVIIENRDAITVLRQQDRAETLHYVDPPYVHDTRARRNIYDVKHHYQHELSDDQHTELAAVLHGLEGMVVLSGYPSDLYERLYGDWQRTERHALADGARDRVEVLWLNEAAANRLSVSQPTLLGLAAR